MDPQCGSPSEANQKLVQLQAAEVPLYKPSRFNAFTLEGEQGVLLVYNSYTGHRCAFPASSADLARNFLSQETLAGPLDPVGQYLLSKGYLVPKEADEDARWDVVYGMEQYRRDRLELILLASEDCNFRCIYCSQAFKRGSMLPQVREGVKNLVRNKIKKLSVLNISWFGGEPMLGYDAIEELTPFFQDIAREHDVAYFSDITTNAYLLSPERSAKMVKWGITNYQITVDGAAEEHDVHRPLKDGGATFQQIFDNIVAMKRIEQDFMVRVRCNYDHTNYPHLDKLMALLSTELAGDSRYTMTFYPVGKWGGPHDEKLDVCGMKEQAKVATFLREEAGRFGLNSEKASRFLEPGGSNVCYAARPYNYIIGSDGKIMKCTVVLDTMKENVVGTLREDGVTALNRDLLVKWIQPYYKTDKMCNRCFFVPVCEGNSCPLPRIQSSERPCPPTKLEIHQTLRSLWVEEGGAGKRKVIPAPSDVEAPSPVPAEQTVESGSLAEVG